MTLGDVLEMMRRADKVTVHDSERHNTLFTGCACHMPIEKKGLMDRKVGQFYPELLDGLHIILKGG